jgi:hypothetical protein
VRRPSVGAKKGSLNSQSGYGEIDRCWSGVQISTFLGVAQLLSTLLSVHIEDREGLDSNGSGDEVRPTESDPIQP